MVLQIWVRIKSSHLPSFSPSTKLHTRGCWSGNVVANRTSTRKQKKYPHLSHFSLSQLQPRVTQLKSWEENYREGGELQVQKTLHPLACQVKKESDTKFNFLKLYILRNTIHNNNMSKTPPYFPSSHLQPLATPKPFFILSFWERCVECFKTSFPHSAWCPWGPSSPRAPTVSSFLSLGAGPQPDGPRFV